MSLTSVNFSQAHSTYANEQANLKTQKHDASRYTVLSGGYNASYGQMFDGLMKTLFMAPVIIASLAVGVATGSLSSALITAGVVGGIIAALFCAACKKGS